MHKKSARTQDDGRVIREYVPKEFSCQLCGSTGFHSMTSQALLYDEYGMKCVAVIECPECYHKAIDGQPLLSIDGVADRRKTSGWDYKSWSSLIKGQYNNICVACGKSHKTMIAHHLYNRSDYPQLANDEQNGVCLCVQCHIDFHSFMGGFAAPCTPDDFDNWRYYHNTIESPLSFD